MHTLRELFGTGQYVERMWDQLHKVQVIFVFLGESIVQYICAIGVMFNASHEGRPLRSTRLGLETWFMETG